jgi:hypothetical protein
VQRAQPVERVTARRAPSARAGWMTKHRLKPGLQLGPVQGRSDQGAGGCLPVPGRLRAVGASACCWGRAARLARNSATCAGPSALGCRRRWKWIACPIPRIRASAPRPRRAAGGGLAERGRGAWAVPAPLRTETLARRIGSVRRRLGARLRRRAGTGRAVVRPAPAESQGVASRRGTHGVPPCRIPFLIYTCDHYQAKKPLGAGFSGVPSRGWYYGLRPRRGPLRAAHVPCSWPAGRLRIARRAGQ